MTDAFDDSKIIIIIIVVVVAIIRLVILCYLLVFCSCFLNNWENVSIVISNLRYFYSFVVMVNTNSVILKH